MDGGGTVTGLDAFRDALRVLWEYYRASLQSQKYTP